MAGYRTRPDRLMGRFMAVAPPSPRLSGSALTHRQFVLLFGGMLVASSGNTALQSVMPAIGRAIGLPDLAVVIAYTVSAILWVMLAPTWARLSDRHGRKTLILVGVGGFAGSMLLCGVALEAGINHWLSAGAAFTLFALCRCIYGGFGSATPSATQAYLASKTRRSARVAALSTLSSSFGLGTVIGPALAPLFVLPLLGLPGPLFGFAGIGVTVWLAIHFGLPDDLQPRHGHRRGQGAAMSYPSLASAVTGASVVAATHPRPRAGAARLKWSDPRIRRWIIAGVATGHAQAATLTCLGFFVIDRLHLPPLGAEKPISIVLMAGAAATLAAQWGIIPRLGLTPRGLILSGALVAAAGLAVTMVAHDLYGLVLGFGLASLGFGFTRPGFTAGASLGVPMAEQGAVAGVITAANGISYVAAPSLGMLLYGLAPPLPFAVCALLCVVVAGWGRARL